MSELVKQVRNVFIDSETNTTIDKLVVPVNLIPSDFWCNSDENMRMTLTTLECRMNWYNINQYNNVFYIFTPTTAGSVTGTYYQVTIPPRTYYDFVDAPYNASPVTATGLATAIQTALNTTATTVINDGGVYPVTIGVGHTCVYDVNTRKFTISLDTTGSGGTLTALSYIVSFAVPFIDQPLPTNVSGSYIFMDTNEILGGVPCRFIPSIANGPPVECMVGSGTTTRVFVSPFVAQLNSIEALYLRTNLQSSNYSTYGFSQSVFQNAVQPSNIFARIPMKNTFSIPADPFIVLEDKNNLFTVEIGNKQLDNITLILTDDKNRPIPAVANGQVTAGMLSFKCSIKWEVIVRDSATPFIPTLANVNDKLIAFPRRP